MSKEWHAIFSASAAIPPCKERLKSLSQTASTPFAVKLNGCELRQVDIACDYQIRAYFYDTKWHCFFGRPWRSRWTEATGQKVLFNETLFFHTPLKDKSVLLVLELISRKRTAKDSSNLLGWSPVRLFSNEQQLEDCSSRDRGVITTVELFGGSPKFLVFLAEPIEMSSQLVRAGGSVSYSLLGHRLLARAFDFLPENTILGSDEVVPGLELLRNGMFWLFLSTASPLMNPVPKAPAPAYLDSFVVHLGPDAERIETRLCETINRERVFKDNKDFAANSDRMIISERRIRIGVHNGWTYLQEPYVYHLTFDNSTGGLHSMRRKGSAGSGHARTRSLDASAAANSLVLRNRVELNELVQDSGLAIVISLDFVFGLQTAKPNPPSASVAVCWGVWSPFVDQTSTARSSARISVPLYGGPAHNPDDVLCFRNLYRLVGHAPTPSPNVTAEFRFCRKDEDEEESAGESAAAAAGRAVSQPDVRQQVASPAKSESPISESVLSPPASSTPQPHAPPTRRNRQSAQPDGERKAKSGKTTPSVITPPVFVEAPSRSAPPPPQISATVARAAQMVELPTDGLTTAQLVPLPDPNDSISSIPRSTFALFDKLGFGKILDRHGDTPTLVDPAYSSNVNLAAELDDPLDCNELIFQFLALSSPTNRRSNDVLPRRCFMSFQFYRFPVVNSESLLLTDATESGALRIFRRLDAAGCVPAGHPGYTVKFSIDPQFLKAGERRQFLQFLASHHLHIDVWDADSLMLIGSAMLPLAILCRRGNEAVQSYVRLAVGASEMRVGVGGGGAATVLRALLTLRVANVGYPHTRSNGHVALPMDGSRNAATVSHQLRAHHRAGGHTRRVVARPLSVRNGAVQPQLHSDGDAPMDDERKRKLERLEAVRQIEKAALATTDKRTRETMMRDLQSLKTARQENKPQVLLTALLNSITTVHTVYPTLGSAEFMEFSLRNPFNESVTLTVDISDQDLQLVTDYREWHFYKTLYGITTGMEHSMFLQDGGAVTQLFLKPRESVYVPFKYQTFHYICRPDQCNDQGNTYSLQSKTAQVTFRRSESEELISVFVLHVEPQPHILQRSFRFYHEENNFFNRVFPIGAEATGGADRVRGVHCTDAAVVCQVLSAPDGGAQQLLLKVGCGASASVRQFDVLFYTDAFRSRVSAAWRLRVHALQRIDLSTTQGQRCRATLTVGGESASRMVQLFASSPAISFEPADPFLVQATGVSQVDLHFTPLSLESNVLQVNAVDVELRQLLKGWLVYTTVHPASVTKTFQVTVPIGMEEPLNKKIPFTNTYNIAKTFHVRTSRADLVVPKEATVGLAAQTSGTIGLQFHPANSSGVSEALVFIHDIQGNNEAVFSLKIVYVVS